MGRGFDTALVNRERDRLKLAEALEEKYAAERRGRLIARCFVLGVLGAIGFYVARGVLFVADHVKPPPLAQAPKKDILEQMKQQLAEGDPMLIGQSAPARNGPAKSRGERESFAPGQVPINVYTDLHRTSDGSKRPGYSPAGAGEKLPLDQLAARASRHPPVDYGKYRPAVPDDLRKLPQPGKSRASSSLYAQVGVPPLRLADDEREFPPAK